MGSGVSRDWGYTTGAQVTRDTSREVSIRWHQRRGLARVKMGVGYSTQVQGPGKWVRSLLASLITELNPPDPVSRKNRLLQIVF